MSEDKKEPSESNANNNLKENKKAETKEMVAFTTKKSHNKRNKRRKTDLQKQWTEVKQRRDSLVQEIELINMEKIAYHAREINKLCAQRNKNLNKTNRRYNKEKD